MVQNVQASWPCAFVYVMCAVFFLRHRQCEVRAVSKDTRKMHKQKQLGRRLQAIKMYVNYAMDIQYIIPEMSGIYCVQWKAVIFSCGPELVHFRSFILTEG